MNEEEYRQSCVLGIDPGSACLGLATLWFDSKTLELSSVQATTLYGAKYIKNKEIDIIHGGTQSMLLGHQKYIEHHLMKVKPIAVFCESPFYNSRMPSAFGSLVRTIEHIRSICIAHDPYMSLCTVDPPTAKKAIGASGSSGDKSNMFVALQKQSWYELIEFTEITEHAIDATAIGYWGYKEFIVTEV